MMPALCWMMPALCWASISSPGHLEILGRGDRIRTCDPHTPSVMRYQAALRPDRGWGTYARGARDASAVALVARSCLMDVALLPCESRLKVSGLEPHSPLSPRRCTPFD